MPNNKSTEEGIRDLLAVISEAVDVPVAEYDDRESELYLLRSRTAAISGVLAAVAEDGVTPGSAARTLHRATAAEPVTYAVAETGVEVLVP